MKNPGQPNNEELLQLAALEAFGLLDEFESAEYTRWFDDAPATVQDEIVEFQASLVTDGVFLSADEPSPELRQRVIEVVAEAIENDSAPLARIGRGRGAGVAGRVGISRSGQFWRAAAFAMAAALIVCLYFINDVLNDSHSIAKIALGAETDTQLRELIGPGFEEFRNHPACEHRVLRSPEGDFPGYAVVYINEATNEALLVTVGMPKGQGPYSLHLDTADAPAIASMTPSGIIGEGIRIEDIGSNALLAATWVITSATGEIVLSS